MARTFLDLHRPGDPLLLANAWDAGSARILAELGYAAVATTSSGFAATLGRADGSVSRTEALGHAAAVAAAVDVPVSADLENGFGDTPDEVARTAEGARGAGLAGFSIEDATGRADAPVHDATLAAERIAAAAEASGGLVLTGRCENYLYGRPDLADTITRLQAYQEAGADVLFAPGLHALKDIATLVRAVDRPVNVLLRPGGPTPAELAEAGVARVSVGGTFAWAAYAGLIEAARELLAGGTAFHERAGEARVVIDRALAPRDAG
ncbi:isocitrate lyase/PEP mutase family protein [Myceligenerans salitolerans]|uniref:Isocitrate lyase/phosphoenolpyruvate mutase family protein n=1 Tax=Myceligenerans salitolerans TaxID=1230528 RepID=A0ABS3IAX7_9MICO|nr:isocitrate lyase/phosphoenolpyruvate mutase family protein [Myceligenerans salitolerans]MBO0610100.1 isocitrate lyase/phosphoenolpyruvate mutase family protein [Myceligenerans salitolerans]